MIIVNRETSYNPPSPGGRESEGGGIHPHVPCQIKGGVGEGLLSFVPRQIKRGVDEGYPFSPLPSGERNFVRTNAGYYNGKANMDKETPAELSELSVTFGSGKTKLTGKILFPNTQHPVPGAILCHGLGSSYRAVEPSARIMANRGVAVLIFDFHGHGRSGGVFDGNMVTDVVDAWHFLSGFPGVDKRRIALIGHSMGAAAAVLASRQVSPHALIALSCPPEPPASWLAKPLTVVSPIWAYLAGYRLHADWRAFFRALAKTKLSTSLRELKSCSTLFVHCRGDRLTPYRLTMKLYEKANRPKDLLLAEGGFHSAPLLSRSLRSQWTQWAVATLMN